jgi:PKD repeat protein
LDGSSSSDPDGTVASYAWTFGDGTTAAGARVSHAFPQPGSYPVTLTVTDTQGATGTRTQPVEVTAAPISTAQLDFVGAASTNGNRTSHSVTVPATVKAGDLLLAYLSTNDSVVGVTAPAGWTDLASTVASGTAVRVWSRTATAADAGAQVTATSSGFTKSDLSVAAYRSSGGTAHAGQAASVLDTTLGTQHTTPTVTAGTGDWLVSYWSREASTTPTWTQPAGQVLRTSSAGAGTGNISAILTDGGSPVAAGTVGGLTATTSEAVSRAPMVSVVVSVR